MKEESQASVWAETGKTQSPAAWAARATSRTSGPDSACGKLKIAMPVPSASVLGLRPSGAPWKVGLMAGSLATYLLFLVDLVCLLLPHLGQHPIQSRLGDQQPTADTNGRNVPTPYGLICP